MSEFLALVPPGLGPQDVARGFAESRLDLIRAADDPSWLWGGSRAAAAYAEIWRGHGAATTECKSLQMFCEIQLGQLLGGNPGRGGIAERDDAGQILARVPKSHDSLGIPSYVASDLRRFLGHFDALVEAIRNGARSRRSLLLEVDRIEAAGRPEPTVGNLDIRAGDFREVLGDIEPGSVALVLTDPPYPMEYLPLWDALGDWSAEHLMGGGSLVAYCGQAIVLDAYARLSRHLNYWWTLVLTEPPPLPTGPFRVIVAGVGEATVRRDLRVDAETPDDESEPATIVNARGQRRPQRYKPRGLSQVVAAGSKRVEKIITDAASSGVLDGLPLGTVVTHDHRVVQAGARRARQSIPTHQPDGRTVPGRY